MHVNDPHRRDLRLNDLGWNSFFENQFANLGQAALVPARVTEDFKHCYRGARCARRVSGGHCWKDPI